jgi:hypothetical protein
MNTKTFDSGDFTFHCEHFGCLRGEALKQVCKSITAVAAAAALAGCASDPPGTKAIYGEPQELMALVDAGQVGPDQEILGGRDYNTTTKITVLCALLRARIAESQVNTLLNKGADVNNHAAQGKAWDCHWMSSSISLYFGVAATPHTQRRVRTVRKTCRFSTPALSGCSGWGRQHAPAKSPWSKSERRSRPAFAPITNGTPSSSSKWTKTVRTEKPCSQAS